MFVHDCTYIYLICKHNNEVKLVWSALHQFASRILLDTLLMSISKFPKVGDRKIIQIGTVNGKPMVWGTHILGHLYIWHITWRKGEVVLRQPTTTGGVWTKRRSCHLLSREGAVVGGGGKRVDAEVYWRAGYKKKNPTTGCQAQVFCRKAGEWPNQTHQL